MFESFLGVNPWTALFVLLNTLVIFFVARKYLFGPVTKIIEERQKEIDDLYSQADSARTHAESMEQEYREKLSAAQETSQRMVSEAVQRGQAREEEILRDARAEADRMLAKAEADIHQEKKKAISEAKGEISDLAVAIAEKVVQREINADDQKALVENFLKELGESV